MEIASGCMVGLEALFKNYAMFLLKKCILIQAVLILFYGFKISLLRFYFRSIRSFFPISMSWLEVRRRLLSGTL